LKNVLSNYILRDSALEKEYFVLYPDYVDLRHLNSRGHHVLADLLAAYIRRQICEEARNKLYERFDPLVLESHFLPSISTIEDIPRLLLYSKYNQNETVPDINPTCMSMSSSKHPLKAFSSNGWVEWSWKDKPYLIGKKPGDRITFEVKVDVLGTVSVAYLRSKTLGLGKLKCWLNGRPNRPQFVSGYWDFDNLNLVRKDHIVVGAPPGKHLVHCEIMKETDDPKGGHEFRIVAVTST
ncbi:CRISPR-associated endonuclease/helicase Cas3, partial [Tulasnella sp. 419]